MCEGWLHIRVYLCYKEKKEQVIGMNVLVIEDDKKLSQMLGEILKKEGYNVKICNDGEEGAFYFQQNAFDLALIDWMLPGKSGPEILRESRAKGIMTPVVMLTALTSVENKVTCLDAGADDYLGKPFDRRELLARVRANLRRRVPIEDTIVMQYGDLIYNAKSRGLKCGGNEVSVSRKLGSMVELFMRSEGQVVSRATLFARVWGADAEVEDGIIDNYVGFFRRRLQTLHSKMILKTVRGVGYALVEEETFT